MNNVSAREEGPTGEPGVPREAERSEGGDAWFEYLAATRGQTAARYKEVEQWAWARLSQRLRAIRTKRQKLRPARAA